MEIIPKLEGGYWFVVAITLMMAAATQDSDPGGKTFLGRIANRIALYIVCIPASFAAVSFLAGCGLLVYKTFLYLKLGAWPPFYLVDIVTVLDLHIRDTGWLGVDQMVVEILNWSALTSLLLWIPVASLALLGISVLLLRWLVKQIW